MRNSSEVKVFGLQQVITLPSGRCTLLFLITSFCVFSQAWLGSSRPTALSMLDARDACMCSEYGEILLTENEMMCDVCLHGRISTRYNK